MINDKLLVKFSCNDRDPEKIPATAVYGYIVLTAQVYFHFSGGTMLLPAIYTNLESLVSYLIVGPVRHGCTHTDEIVFERSRLYSLQTVQHRAQ